MITHIVVGTNDPAASMAFYDAVFGALNIQGVHMGDRAFYRSADGGPALVIGPPANGQPATFANGGTIGLAAADASVVDAFHAAGLAHGGTDEGAPGPRTAGPVKNYGAYLRDPDGNKLCASCPLPE